ncbi:hypothetical protein BHU09_05395 [Tannerella sp. oral taxon 808]|nr:hypothetical protein BHU09_05395 [Tannerella sp. oral taxon 808]
MQDLGKESRNNTNPHSKSEDVAECRKTNLDDIDLYHVDPYNNRENSSLLDVYLHSPKPLQQY